MTIKMVMANPIPKKSSLLLGGMAWDFLIIHMTTARAQSPQAQQDTDTEYSQLARGVWGKSYSPRPMLANSG